MYSRHVTSVFMLNSSALRKADVFSRFSAVQTLEAVVLRFALGFSSSLSYN